MEYLEQGNIVVYDTGEDNKSKLKINVLSKIKLIDEL